MKIAFHGAARTVTGSKHLVTLNNGKKILLDLGVRVAKSQHYYPLPLPSSMQAYSDKCSSVLLQPADRQLKHPNF